jgi:excisionase family DNA binding protein
MQNIILTQFSVEQFQSEIANAVRLGLEQLQTTQNTTTTTEQTELLTRNEVCDLLHITLPTLHNWTKEGLITGYRIGTRIRYKRAEVLATLNKVQQIKFRRAI